MDNPRTHAAREAAQRADEAELAQQWSDHYARAIVTASLAGQIGYRATGPMDYHVPGPFDRDAHEHGCRFCHRLRFAPECEWAEAHRACYEDCQPSCQDDAEPTPADEAELLPMAGGSEAPHCPDCGESGAARDCEPCVLATEHTPGPWRWTYQGDSRATVDAPRRNGGGQRFTMAEVKAFSPAETEANARLVAAAPALLEACQQVLARLDLEAQERGPGAVFPCAAQRDTLRAVIAQATSTEHTHPCPTCHHERSCACTVFTPGEPLECATCSNCRGW